MRKQLQRNGQTATLSARGQMHRSRRSATLKIAAMAATVAALGATLQPASAQFVSVTDFGDSYADTGSAPGGAFRLLGAGFYDPCPTGYTSCRFTGSTTFVDSLQAIYGLPTALNYAIGGARTDNTNSINDEVPAPPVVLPGFTYQLQQFILSGARFTERDLVLLSIGGNDMSAIGPGDDIQTSATASAQRAAAGVELLAASGARTIAWLGTGSTKYFPLPPEGAGGRTFDDTERDLWADTYYQQTQQLLAPLAHSGVRIFLFNFGILQARIAADPTQYGFDADPTCQAVLGEGDTCFYYNGVHPTGTAMDLIARFMANQIDAPTTVVPQGRITTSLATTFTTSALGRLDSDRTFNAFSVGPTIAASRSKMMPEPVTADSPWSSYGGITYSSSDFDRQFYASAYDYHAVAGTIGVQYRAAPNLRLGAEFGYTEPTVDLTVQDAHDSIKSYQFAGYSSYTGANWFADGLVAYGRQNYSIDRQGVSDTIHGSTDADTFSTAAKGGYLFDIGRLRAGPIAGLNFTDAAIDAYTETGDELLIMAVDRQSFDAFTGEAGLQVRFPFLMGGGVYSPYINLTAERDFSDSGRILTTTLVSAPLLPVLTPVPGHGGTYGRLAAGIAATIDGNVSATMNAATTFARDGGDDVAVSGGIKVAF